jgi:hypothetical protein
MKLDCRHAADSPRIPRSIADELSLVESLVGGNGFVMVYSENLMRTLLTAVVILLSTLLSVGFVHAAPVAPPLLEANPFSAGFVETDGAGTFTAGGQDPVLDALVMSMTVNGTSYAVFGTYYLNVETTDGAATGLGAFQVGGDLYDPFSGALVLGGAPVLIDATPKSLTYEGDGVFSFTAIQNISSIFGQSGGVITGNVNVGPNFGAVDLSTRGAVVDWRGGFSSNVVDAKVTIAAVPLPPAAYGGIALFAVAGIWGLRAARRHRVLTTSLD